AWNNRIRYAVAREVNASSCIGTCTTPHFTSRSNLKQKGRSCLRREDDLLVCRSSVSSPPPTPGDCGPAGNALTNANPSGAVVAILFTTGRNYASAKTAADALAAGRPDEAANLDGNSVFISHTPTPAGATGGEFDDIVVWLSVGSFYGRLAAGGVL